MRALNLLRDTPHYRRSAFTAGLKAAGFEVVQSLPKPRADDVLVIWNRYSAYAEQAQHFERAGARVVVVENGHLGKDWLGDIWFAMAFGHHSGAGTWPQGGPERWDSLGVELEPWRKGGTETVVLAQRGIGEPGIASPPRWAESMRMGRVRAHPGQAKPDISLADDLRDARAVVTWHSGAALHALLWGVPVFYGFPQWIGAEAARPVAEYDQGPRYGNRLATFRRLAWAQWRLDEIESGEALRALLCAS